MLKEYEQLLKYDTNKFQHLIMDLREKDPQNPQYLYLLARAYLQKGEVSKAIAAYKKSLIADPEYTHALMGLCILYNDIGFYKEAKKLYETLENTKKNVLKKKLWNVSVENFHSNYYTLSQDYLSYGRYEEALEECQKVLKDNPNDKNFLLLKAKILFQKGETHFAEKILLDLKKIDKNFLEARKFLASIYYHQGKFLETEEEWSWILLKEPHNEEGQKILESIQLKAETSLESFTYKL